MASSGFNDTNSQLNDSFDEHNRKRLTSEHEDTIKTDQMATKKLSNSNEKPHIEDFDETQLKSLLEEAMDYKSPRDADHKSDTFKQFLKCVTEEDRTRNDCYNLGTYGLKQSNSLQNLLDDSHYQSNTHQSHTSGKKHHQRRKNSTSVSARRLEGGSLPIDMHHSSAVQSPPDQPFLKEYKKDKKRKEKQQKDTVIDIGDNETDEKKLMQRHFETKDNISSSYPHDGIEMKPMSYTNQVNIEFSEVNIPTTITTIAAVTPRGGPPLATASIINPKVSCSANTTSTAMHSVDKIIEFPSLMESYQQQNQIIDMSGSTINHNNNIVLANAGLSFCGSSGGGKMGGLDTASLQLNSSYTAVTSLTSNEKTTAKTYMNKAPNHENLPTPTLIQTAPMIAAAHHSGNAANSKETKSKLKRVQKTNEMTVDVKSIQGYRGEREIEDLLKYIEDGGGKNHKNHPKNGIVSNNQAGDHLLSSEEKKKKMAAKSNKVNKLKKSNSMDELCSTGRQQQQQQEKSTTAANKIIEDVALRSKSSNLTSGAKKGDKNEKSQQKRNERRSWGTEGLWPETATAVVEPEDNQEIETSSSSSSSGITAEVIPDPSAVVTSEPVNMVVSETEFHVVMKKRKVKRKQSETSELSKATGSLNNYKRDGNVRPGTRTYNDRDVGAKNARNTKPLNQDVKTPPSKNRRKSTSSMPPSDDDWNSDGGDSVQSLPIETTKTTSSQLLAATVAAHETTQSTSSSNDRKNKKQQQKPATFSYADIAKTNANRNNVSTSTEKWPSISASSSSTTSHQNNDPFSIANFEAVNNSSSNQKTPKVAPVTTSMMSFPELVETNNNKNKQLSSNPSASSLLENTSNGETIYTTEKPLNGLEAPRAFDSNNNSNVAADERQKISYSQSLLESHFTLPELDSNGNNVKVDAASTNGPVPKAVLTKSKSVDHNNLSSIEHYPALEKTHATLGQVFSTRPAVTFETHASKSKQNMKEDRKQMKKDKLKKSSSMQNPQFPHPNAILNCRPAVIILNDSTKPSDADCGITFGFDINEHLLFGHQNGEDASEDVCVTEVSLATTNNNNNCDITNTNLSSNYLTNQPCGLEIYENFIAPQNIIIGDGHIMAMTMNSQSSPKLQLQLQNALDTSNQSSNDMGYLSSSLITNSTSPANNDEQTNDAIMLDVADSQTDQMEFKRSAAFEGYELKLPRFIMPDPIKFNNEEVVSYIIDEFTKVSRTGNVFSSQ